MKPTFSGCQNDTYIVGYFNKSKLKHKNLFGNDVIIK